MSHILSSQLTATSPRAALSSGETPNSSTASFGLNLDQFIVFEQSLNTDFEQVAPDQENQFFHGLVVILTETKPPNNA